MDADAKSLLRQLRQHRKALELYDKARMKMIDKEHRALALTDAIVQKELKAIGVDVNGLLKDTLTEAKELQRTHKKLLTLARPPMLPGESVFEIPPDPNVFDVKPPAVDGFGTYGAGLDRGINLPLGEMNFATSEQDSGWGWLGISGEANKVYLTTLVFEFTPPRAGNILVDAYVDVRGQFSISAHDHWYTDTRARLQLHVSSRLYQHYWEYGPTAVLLNESRTNSSNSGWLDQIQKVSYSTSVSESDTVLLFVEVSLGLFADSSHARVVVDFKTGADRRIRVPLIQIRYF